MDLRQLEIILLVIVIIAVFFFGILIIFYYWHSRKTSNNYLENHELKLRYFIQKQVDHTGATIGYECLLRQENPDGTWQLPQKLDSLPLQRVIFLLENTFKALPTAAITLSINLEYNQIVSPEFEYFVRWAIAKISPMKLTIEYTVGHEQHHFNKSLFENRIRRARQYQMAFSIDNVGSTLKNLKEIEWMLPFVDNIKCSMRDFRKNDPNEWLDLNLQSWRQISQEHQINLILMGIENETDQALAQKLKINTRQGFLFGHPENPAGNEDSSDENNEN